jgi:hypothetical protein
MCLKIRWGLPEAGLEERVKPPSNTFLESARVLLPEGYSASLLRTEIYDETCGIRDHFEAGIGLKLRFLQTATLLLPA